MCDHVSIMLIMCLFTVCEHTHSYGDDMETLIAHKMKVHLNNRQSSWMRNHCVAARLAYNFAVDKLTKPLMAYHDCLDAAHEPTRFHDRIDGGVQPYFIDFKKVKFPSAFDVSKAWTVERDGLYPWMRREKLNLDTISGVFANNYAAALNNWKSAKWARDKMPKRRKKSAQLSSTWRGRSIKMLSRDQFALPNKMGSFRLGCPLRFSGEIRSVTFSLKAGEWFASFLMKTNVAELPEAPFDSAVGVDVGVVQFVSTSDGKQYPPGMDYARELERLAKLQRQQSKMQGPVRGHRKASRNWMKQQQRVQKQHASIANKRRHYIECISKDLAQSYRTVAIEDLKIKNMTASAKGDAEKPGKRVAQKAGLNRSILNGGFFAFRTRLTSKVNSRKGIVIAVNPAYTSQTCSACGFVDKGNRVDQATFRCLSCGHQQNADINAAQNILMRALQPDMKIVVPARHKTDCGQQGASGPESLPTEPAAVLAQEGRTQDALTPTGSGRVVARKRVRSHDQLELSL